MTGGGGGTNGGPSVPDGGTDCASIFVEVQLSSPKPAVISKLQLKEVMTVEVRQEKGHPVLYAMTDRGEAAGTIIHAQSTKIANCIDQGNPFVAVVKRLDRGLCVVEVRPRGT